MMRVCCFCKSSKVKRLYEGVYHPWKSDHGPFTFYKCLHCQSGFTYPLPTSGDQEKLYKAFSGGMIPRIRNIRDANPLIEWYKYCMDQAVGDREGKFDWIDIGAGGGEITEMILKNKPSSFGWAYDFEEKPLRIIDSERFRWCITDLNKLTTKELVSADVIFMITVLEHLLYPDKILQDLVSKLNSGGKLYLTVPDFSSHAAKLMGKKWPYFLPGEHISIPSLIGMQLLLETVAKENNIKADIHVRRISLPYPIGYYLQYFRIRSPKFLSSISLSLPTGLLEASLVKK